MLDYFKNKKEIEIEIKSSMITIIEGRFCISVNKGSYRLSKSSSAFKINPNSVGSDSRYFPSIGIPRLCMSRDIK